MPNVSPPDPSADAATYTLIGVTVLMIVAGQLLLKAGASGLTPLSAEPRAGAAFVARALTTPAIFAGLAFAFAAALSWIAVLARTELSFAYPFMILPVVLVLALSPLLLGEGVSLTRWLGVAVVFVGLVIAARG